MSNDINDRYGPWCLVAGAAEGLGKAFSQALAEKGMNLILVDHQRELLDSMYWPVLPEQLPPPVTWPHFLQGK